VVGGHSYDEPNQGNPPKHYVVNVSINDVGGSSAKAVSAATVAPSPLDTPGGKNLVVALNKPLVNTVIGSFRDQDSLNTLGSDYAGTINWGDGKTSAVKCVFTSAVSNVGSYWNIVGSHAFAKKGTYTVTIRVADLGTPTVFLLITTTITVN
jgi:hypothetical protein